MIKVALHNVEDLTQKDTKYSPFHPAKRAETPFHRHRFLSQDMNQKTAETHF